MGSDENMEYLSLASFNDSLLMTEMNLLTFLGYVNTLKHKKIFFKKVIFFRWQLPKGGLKLYNGRRFRFFESMGHANQLNILKKIFLFFSCPKSFFLL